MLLYNGSESMYTLSPASVVHARFHATLMSLVSTAQSLSAAAYKAAIRLRCYALYALHTTKITLSTQMSNTVLAAQPSTKQESWTTCAQVKRVPSHGL